MLSPSPSTSPSPGFGQLSTYVCLSSLTHPAISPTAPLPLILLLLPSPRFLPLVILSLILRLDVETTDPSPPTNGMAAPRPRRYQESILEQLAKPPRLSTLTHHLHRQRAWRWNRRPFHVNHIVVQRSPPPAPEWPRVVMTPPPAPSPWPHIWPPTIEIQAC